MCVCVCVSVSALTTELFVGRACNYGLCVSIHHGKRTLGQKELYNTGRGRCVNTQAFSDYGRQLSLPLSYQNKDWLTPAQPILLLLYDTNYKTWPVKTTECNQVVLHFLFHTKGRFPWVGMVPAKSSFGMTMTKILRPDLAWHTSHMLADWLARGPHFASDTHIHGLNSLSHTHVTLSNHSIKVVLYHVYSGWKYNSEIMILAVKQVGSNTTD